jgi:hypothetical protein
MLRPRPLLLALTDLLILSVVLKYGLNKFFWSVSFIPIP